MIETDTLTEERAEELRGIAEADQDAAREQEAVEKSRVHPLDPDFLVFALPVAMIFDALDIILELTAVFVIPKIIGIVIDAFVFIVISWWMYTRVKRIAQTREQMKKGAAQKLQKGQQKLQQQLAKSVQRGPLRKVLLRGGITLLGELVPFVGILPFWTITVFSTLREK